MGQGTLTYGTSLSAPIWASLLTIINEDRIAAGKPSVGFVNPLLYANPQAFFDVTQGTNPGCGTQGFPASPGWGKYNLQSPFATLKLQNVSLGCVRVISWKYLSRDFALLPQYITKLQYLKYC